VSSFCVQPGAMNVNSRISTQDIHIADHKLVATRHQQCEVQTGCTAFNGRNLQQNLLLFRVAHSMANMGMYSKMAYFLSKKKLTVSSLIGRTVGEVVNWTQLSMACKLNLLVLFLIKNKHIVSLSYSQNTM
jgi:hypothetical protein